MTIETGTRPGAIGYADRPVTKPPDWHGLVASDMLFNNLATGTFLVAAVGELLTPAIFSATARVGYPLALVFLVTDLLCLVLDLGDPLRFHHMLRVFKPGSPMSLGTWCLTAFSFPLAAVVVLGLLPSDRAAVEPIRKTAIVLGLLPALGSAAYKGVLISTNSQPGWRDGRWLGGYLSNSAILLGCTVVLVVAALTGQEPALGKLRPALELLILLNVVGVLLLYANLRNELVRIYTAQDRYNGLTTVVGLAVFAQFLLFAGKNVGWPIAAAVVLLVQAIAVRFMIVRIPHAHPLKK
jgi:Ni/Fe-hydrogenase subunit HybB-like protein